MTTENGPPYVGGGDIPTYVAELDGKMFNSNYIYKVEFNNGYPYLSNGYLYYGSIATFVYPSDMSGTATAVDESKGLFSLGGNAYQALGASENGQYLTFSEPYTTYGAQQDYFIISNDGMPPPDGIAFDSSNIYSAPSPTCFATGTMIATPFRAIAVEQLREGDAVIGADGRVHRVIWIGHRHTECAKSPWKADVSPILFEPGSIADNVPSRPLMVSPGHSIEIESGWLLQAGHLINGSSIRQLDVPSVTYWHVELEEHAILLANGVPAESYLDVGNRSEFANGGVEVVLHPRFKAEQLDRYCMPVIQDPVIRSYYRDKLAQRAELAKAA